MGQWAPESYGQFKEALGLDELLWEQQPSLVHSFSSFW